MKGYRHRETKAYLFQNRQITDSYMCDLILSQTASGAPYTLAYRTSSKKRRKAKNTFKKASGIVAKEAKRTVIVYGDASLTGTKAGYTLIPVKVEQYSNFITLLDRIMFILYTEGSKGIGPEGISNSC